MRGRAFQGASVADLAKACRTSKSLIYHYFPSKDDILYEVMAAHLELLVAAVEEAASASCSGPRERLRALTSSFMRLYAGAARPATRCCSTSSTICRRSAAPTWSPSSGGSSPRRRIRSAPIRPDRRRRAAADDAVLRHDQLDPHLVRARPARSCAEAARRCACRDHAARRRRLRRRSRARRPRPSAPTGRSARSRRRPPRR